MPSTRIGAAITRDHVVLFVGWFVILLDAIAAWAAHSQTIETVGRVLGGTRWAWALLSLHAAAVIVLMAFPFVLVGAFLLPSLRTRLFTPPTPSARWRGLLVLLVASSLMQPLYFIDIGRLLFTLGFLTISAFVLTGVLLFIGPAMPSRVAILTITWLILTTLARLTLQTLITAAKQTPGLDTITGWTIVFTILMICLVAAPLLVVVSTLRAYLSRMLTRLEGAPLTVLATVLLIAAAGGVAVRSAPEVSTSAWALERLLAVTGLLAACLFALRLEALPRVELAHATSTPKACVFWGALGIIALVYIIQAVRIGLGSLYYLNPDGIAYLIIARDFARGIPVIRGYWSPLMPLALAPAIRFGVDPQSAQRLLIGFTGMVWTGVSLLLGRRLGLNRWMLIAMAATMAVITLEVAFIPITPDMLGAVILAGYFLLVTSEAYLTHPVRSGLCVGVLGGLAFYAKFYNLPFLLVHLFLTGVLLVAWGRPFRKVALTVAVAWLTVAISIIPWMAALRSRYGGITLTTSGPINHAVFGPSMTWHPCWDQRLCDSPKDVLIPWEDPQLADYADVGWNPLGSWSNLRHQVFLAQGNIQAFITDLAFELGPLPALGTVFLFLCLVAFGLERRTRFLLAWSLMTILLYLSGYMTFMVATRYILPVIPLAIIGGFRVLQMGFERLPTSGAASLPGWGRAVAVFAIVLSCVNPQTAGLKYLPPDDHCVASTTAQFADQLVPPIAGSDKWINIIAYYSEKRTLGVLPPWTSASDADAELHRFGIRTYVVGEGLQLGTDLLARGDYQLLAETHLCGNNYLILRTPVP